MTDSQLFDMFVAHGVTRAEIAKMDLAMVTRQIGELREGEPDDLGLSDAEIARRILDFARS